MMMTNTFWALVSLILFLLILVYYKVPGMARAALGKRAERISQELEEARRLREEAQQLLAEYQKKRFDAENEANEIISAAQRQAEHIIADIRGQTQAYIARRNKIAEERIAQAEAEAEQSIRSAAIDRAFAAAGALLQQRVESGKGEGGKLFERSLAETKAQLQRKKA